eukprot:6200498-Pleurochrysis_carterae.AAC.4
MRPTPVEAARRGRSSCVDMSACSLLPSIAKQKSAPRDTGDSKMKFPPRMCEASAILTQLEAIALARSTVAGRPPSLCGSPIGYLRVRRTCGAPGSKRAADHVEPGGDATTATQSVFAASAATRSATSSKSCPMPPRSYSTCTTAMPPFVTYAAKSPSLWTPLHRYRTSGEVGSSSRSVATTAAVCRRRRRMRSAIVLAVSVDARVRWSLRICVVLRRRGRADVVEHRVLVNVGIRVLRLCRRGRRCRARYWRRCGKGGR